MERNKKMLKSLEDAANPGAQLLTGMPHMSELKDKVGDLASEIADLKESNNKLQEEIDCETEKVNEFISTIDDAQTRTVFRLRFLRFLRWSEVATAIGGKNTTQSVKMMCYRYINKH